MPDCASVELCSRSYIRPTTIIKTETIMMTKDRSHDMKFSDGTEKQKCHQTLYIFSRVQTGNVTRHGHVLDIIIPLIDLLTDELYYK